MADLFTRYGSPSKEADVQITGHFFRPDVLTRFEDIRYADNRADRLIRDMTEIAEALQEYRQALAARYAELATMPYKLRLEVKRSVSYDGHKHYAVTIYRTYEDGGEVVELREDFPGKERSKALARFEDLKKSRPGIEAVKDIEKGRWER